MFGKSGLRMVLALAFAVSALAGVAAPSAANTTLINCNGTCGYYETYDAAISKKGAVCVYGTSFPYKLNRITVRPPLMHGYYSTKTKVGWRFKIQRMPVGGGPWSTIFTSTYQGAMANDAVPANVGSGFSRRAWQAPSNPAGYFWRVWVELRWWHLGVVEGFARVQYDWYKALRGGSTYTNPDYCLQSY